MRLLRLVPPDTKIDFIRPHKLFFAISALLVLGSVLSYAVQGLNYGIDFKGGVLIEVKSQGPANLAAMRAALSGLGLGEVALQNFGSPEDVLIRVAAQEGGEAANQAAIQAVRGVLDPNLDYRRVETVGPQVGAELRAAATWAALAAIGSILVYVWFRFEWQFGVSGVIALFHDVISTVGLYSVLGLEFNLSSVAAVLTIAGYSINDTIVIFDRVRENMRKYKRMELRELLNLSVNQTLSRTVMTNMTVLLSVAALFVFGGPVIRDFSLAMLFGLFAGTYSTVFVASALLLYMRVRRAAFAGAEESEDAAAPSR